MPSVVRVLASDRTQRELAVAYTLVASYPTFGLFHVSEAEARAVASSQTVHDLTELFAIPTSAAGGSIDTTRPRNTTSGATRRHPAYVGAPRLRAGRHHYLVQFVGPVKQVWLRDLKRAGAEVRAPYSHFTVVARIADEAVPVVCALPFVRWVGHLPWRDRIAPPLLHVSPAEARGFLRDSYVVSFFGAADLQKARRSLGAIGFHLVDSSARARLCVLRTRSGRAASKRQLGALSAVHGVRFVQGHSLSRLSNNVATKIMGTEKSLGKAPGLGLSGKGEIVAVCDSGLDNGDKSHIHPDFRGRVVAIKSYPIDSQWDGSVNNPGGDDGPADYGGHGTHVAGSILGNGAASPKNKPPIRGLAYRAKLVFQAIEQQVEWKGSIPQEPYGLLGLPLDMSTFYDWAYGQGARIHNNSWDGGVPGQYELTAEQIDNFVWSNPDFCVVVAAGNNGTDTDGDGLIDPISVASPGTAKNCITVGASESLRPGFTSLKYAELFSETLPQQNFMTVMADNPDEIAPFSNRGPTLSGRVKPDVVAPGTYILSTRSSVMVGDSIVWAPGPSSRYCYIGGTSMATPLVAGALALVREYLRTKRGMAGPSAALMKAAIVAGAARVPGSLGAGPADNAQGWGRVNIDAVLAPKAKKRTVFEDITPGLSTGQSNSRTLQLAADASLRVTLVYSDHPGAQGSLVNTLHLLVTSPTGQQFGGNQDPAGPLVLDWVNNVQVVSLPQAQGGTWTVDVIGANVVYGPQPFALVTIGRIQ